MLDLSHAAAPFSDLEYIFRIFYFMVQLVSVKYSQNTFDMCGGCGLDASLGSKSQKKINGNRNLNLNEGLSK